MELESAKLFPQRSWLFLGQCTQPILETENIVHVLHKTQLLERDGRNFRRVLLPLISKSELVKFEVS